MNAKTFKYKEFLYYAIPAMAVDLVIYLLLYKWVAGVFYYWDPPDLVMKKSRTVYFLIVGFLISSALLPSNFYRRKADGFSIMLRSFFQVLLSYLIFALSVYVLFDDFAGKLYLQAGIITSISVILWHIAAREAVRMARKKGRNKIHCVIVGQGQDAEDLRKFLSSDGSYKMLSQFAHYDSRAREYIAGNKVHAVYCSLSPVQYKEEVNSLVRACENLFIDFYYVPNMDGYLHRTMSSSQVGDTLVLSLREEPLANPTNAFLKRLLDILLSGLFLITLFPVVWIFVFAGTKISSPGPVFFKQKRTGYKGRPFTMLKFRSMKVNADADRLQATADDPRKTKFGDFLRRTSIDELPQFINIFRGDMSIVGPRPHMELHTEQYSALVDEYLVRHLCKPGLTGWAQVNGCRGETKELWQMEERVKNDIWYIENWSLFLDLKIVLMTIVQVFKGDSQAY